MRILYLSASYVPSRRASSVHVMKMSAAMARLGHEVTLATKHSAAYEEPGVADDFAFYGVPEGFEVLKLARPALPGGGQLHQWLMRRVLARRRPDLVYAREAGGAASAAALGLPLVFESHGPPSGERMVATHRQILAAPELRRLVVISRSLRDRLAELGLLPSSDRVLVAADAADPLPETVALDPPEALRRPGPHLGYVGRFHRGKGVELVVELARRRPEWQVHLVGGEPAELRGLPAGGEPPNLSIHGFVPPAELARYYRALDVLLMPYEERVFGATAASDIAPWMSPLKMFEYMAAGKPIVSSDLPVLREVLNDDREAVLVRPADPDAWEVAIEQLLDQPDRAGRLANSARSKFLAQHTWDARARRVLEGL